MRLLSFGVIAGLIGGILMALWSMIVVAIMGDPFFGPARMIAEVFFGPYDPNNIGVVPVIVGIIIHLIFSIIFGLIFAAVWPLFRAEGPVALVAGLLYSVMLFAIMTYGIALAFHSRIGYEMPTTIWVVGHLLFGATLGVAWLLTFDRPISDPTRPVAV